MNNLDYMIDGLPLYRIGNNKIIFLNSVNAIKSGNEYTFNIRNINIHKPSLLSLDTFVFNSSSNYNYFNEIKIKGININPQSYINSDFNGNPTIGSIVFDNNNIPSTYITPTLITGITPIQSGNNVIYNLLNTPSNSYTLILPYDTIGDLLMVGGGGYGGSNVYSGGGGAGEVIYINNYLFSSGTYTINIKNNLGYTPTDVRQYPPKTYTTLSSRSGSSPYYKTMTLDSSGITYGSGDYIIGCSSYYGDSNDIELAFNRVIPTSTTYATPLNNYNGSTFLYAGNNYLVSDYKGEWITIKLPNAISLCYYNIIGAYGSVFTRNPALYKIYGSNDGINWTEITQASNSVNSLSATEYVNYWGIGYSSGTQVMPVYKKILSTPSLSYQYFGMVVSKITGGGGETRMGLVEWELFGFEDAYSNSIPKLNILSHYRDLIPKVYTSVADLGTTTQNGSTNYKWSLTLDSSGIETNETGTYEIVATGSAGYTTSHPYSFIARTLNANTFTCNTTTSYTNGVYNAGKYLESSNYKGEWFFIKLISARLIYGYSIMIGSQLANAMGEWKFYGSMSGLDGSWVEIIDGSQMTRIATTDYVLNGSYYYYSKYFTNPTSYLYYGFCCNKLTTTGTTTLTWGNELYLLSKDILTITDKPSSTDGSVSIIKDNTTLITAKAGGNGGWFYINSRTADFYTYPPKLYNSVSGESTGNYLGKTGVYYQTITLNTTGITYGSGTYTLYSSTTYNGTSNFKSDMFNYSNGDVGAIWGNNQYTSGTGLYNSTTNYLVSGYYGDWLVVQFPEPISLSSLQIGARGGAQTGRAPGLWRTYGSNDGTTFTLLPDFSNDTTSLTTSDYPVGNTPSYSYTRTSGTITPFYNYIGFCVNKLCGTGHTFMNIVELKFFGNKFNVINPTSGGSGGGGCLNNSGSNAGTLFNNIYTTGLVGNGSNGTTSQGGNGGGVSYNSSISGSSITYATAGTGATSSSTPVININGTGDGGDGGAGVGAGGSVSLLLKNVIDYDAYKYISNSGIEIQEQNINQITIYNPNVNNTNLNFNMTLNIEEIE